MSDYGTHNNYGYNTNQYSQCTGAAEARMNQMDAARRCSDAGTHHYETEDGAYSMKCYSCGDTYLRERALFD